MSLSLRSSSDAQYTSSDLAQQIRKATQDSLKLTLVTSMMDNALEIATQAMPQGGEISVNPLVMSHFDSIGKQERTRGKVQIVERSPTTVFGYTSQMDGKTFKVRRPSLRSHTPVPLFVLRTPALTSTPVFSLPPYIRRSRPTTRPSSLRSSSRSFLSGSSRASSEPSRRSRRTSRALTGSLRP